VGTKVYPQIQLGLDLGVNSVYGRSLGNDFFSLSSKFDYTFWNGGCFVSVQRKQNQFVLGYKGSLLDGTYKVQQHSAPDNRLNIIYEVAVNRFYAGYLRRFKSFMIGGNISSFAYSNDGFGISGSFGFNENLYYLIETNFDAPSKWQLIPFLEVGYEIKIKQKYPIIVSLDIPIWKFTGFTIYYQSTFDSRQPQSIAITPQFYAAFLKLRIPIISIGKGWNSISDNTYRRGIINSDECP
jgi:hypothetical protein